ncbi:uncharacterized protein LOC124542390 [Vanessa cardui]|uniref:uncharacterized protein LOC124542390 n=1 Tax=Vanessa cardui TaxID=171605 RepID=UPI001F13C5C6|nr:uncharacterized protein LOC124542390 [Vanessa cardui]
MLIYGIILFLIFHANVVFSTFEESCDDIQCSNVYDPVCGEATALNGERVIKRYHNICYLRMIQCQFKIADVQHIPDDVCNIKKIPVNSISGRRLEDFSIVGAHQACNHTCPTFCLDTYDPACAQIWAHNMQSYVYRPMINHCHIDLYSCVVGVNVTIQPLIGKCYKNPSAINFMFHIASLKTLKLLDEPPSEQISGRRASRRANVKRNRITKKEIKDFLKSLGNRIRMIG